MQLYKWQPVTDDLFKDPYFKAVGRDKNGKEFIFWNGGGDWLTQTGSSDTFDSNDEDICSPVEFRPLNEGEE